MSLAVDDMKNWLRIDHNEDDALLQGMVSAAEQTVKGSIGFVPESDLGIMAMRMIVTDWYENRGSFVQGNVMEIPFGVRTILSQLRYTGDPT